LLLGQVFWGLRPGITAQIRDGWGRQVLGGLRASNAHNSASFELSCLRDLVRQLVRDLVRQLVQQGQQPD
jgi:hypothetical protein